VVADEDVDVLLAQRREAFDVLIAGGVAGSATADNSSRTSNRVRPGISRHLQRARDGFV